MTLSTKEMGCHGSRPAWFARPLPETEPVQDRWTLAEARTDRMLGRHFAVLDEEELAELVDLLSQINAS